MQARSLYFYGFFNFDSARVFALYAFADLGQTLPCIDVKSTKGPASAVCRANTPLRGLGVAGSQRQVR